MKVDFPSCWKADNTYSCCGYHGTLWVSGNKGKKWWVVTDDRDTCSLAVRPHEPDKWGRVPVSPLKANPKPQLYRSADKAVEAWRECKTGIAYGFGMALGNTLLGKRY